MGLLAPLVLSTRAVDFARQSNLTISSSALVGAVGLLAPLGLNTRAVGFARRRNLTTSSFALVVAVAPPALVGPNTKGMVFAGLVDMSNLGCVWETSLFCVLKVPAVWGSGADIYRRPALHK